VAVFLVFLAVEIQLKTLELARLIPRIRREVMASEDRCPSLQKAEQCDLRVLAKRGKTWETCDLSHPPSGADLPMHRWFKVRGRCRLSFGGIRYDLPFPEQEILR